MPPDAPKTVSRQIRLLRLERDLPVKVVALDAGLNPSQLTKLEREKVGLTPKVAARILDALGIALGCRGLLLTQLFVERIAWDELQALDPSRNDAICRSMRRIAYLTDQELLQLTGWLETTSAWTIA